jgi:hypothetical protein
MSPGVQQDQSNNPYADASGEVRPPPSPVSEVGAVRWACIAVRVHCVSVCVCGLLTYLDSRRASPLPGSPAYFVLGIALWIALLAWLICPLVVVVRATRSPSWSLALAALAEVLLCYAQYEVLRPGFQ